MLYISTIIIVHINYGSANVQKKLHSAVYLSKISGNARCYKELLRGVLFISSGGLMDIKKESISFILLPRYHNLP